MVDLLVAATVLILTLPLAIPVAMVLRASGSGEVFSLQRRVGAHRRPFTLIRFATRLPGDPQLDASPITIEQHPYVVAIGRFFNQTGINGLPQFLNILKGDMSLLGPPPLPAYPLADHPEPHRQLLLLTKPGLLPLTGRRPK